MEKLKVLIATTNQGKANIYKPSFEKLGIDMLTLNDLNIAYQAPKEDGKTVIENALIKARYYHALSGLPVLANDSGLYINKFSKEEQAGLFVRRHGEKELTDQELIEKVSKKLEAVGGHSMGHYDVGIAIITPNGKEHVKLFRPKIYFVSKPCAHIKKGVPLDSLAFDKKAKKYKCEMSMEERNATEGKSFSKQDKMIAKAFAPWLKK